MYHNRIQHFATILLTFSLLFVALAACGSEPTPAIVEARLPGAGASQSVASPTSKPTRQAPTATATAATSATSAAISGFAAVTPVIATPTSASYRMRWPTVTPLSSPVPSTIGPRTFDLVLADIPVRVYMPSYTLPAPTSFQAMLVLHGMHSDGPTFSQSVASYADQFKVVILAPTFSYSENWQDPAVLAEEDPRLAAKLNEIVVAAQTQLELSFNPKLLLYGFSRGAQLVHRYALLYPEKALAVAAISGGSYTLPFMETPNGTSLQFPFGVSNIEKFVGHKFDVTTFKRVAFWVEVGGDDNKDNEVSRTFDPLIGKNRLERARNFYNAVKKQGSPCQFTVRPGLGHTIYREGLTEIFNFFEKMEHQA